MGQKQSTAQSQKLNDFAVYLLPDNSEETLAQTQLLVVTQENTNALILFPDPDDASVSSSAQRKYKTYFIQDGHWLQEDKKRKAVSINFNLTDAKFTIPLPEQQNIKLMSPTTPHYKNLLNCALAFIGIQPPQQSVFENLHRHIHEKELPKHYDKKSQFAVAKTSRTLYGYSQKSIKKQKIKLFLDYVIHGEQTKAEALLNKLSQTNLEILPEIFTTRMVVKDFSGRKIEGTAFQLALGAEDVGIQKGEECMAEMLARHMRKIPGGEAELNRQYKQQFPESWEEKEGQRAAIDSVELHKILDVINAVSEAECQAVHTIDDEIQKRLRQKKSKNYDPAPLQAIEQAVLHADKDKLDLAFDQLKKYLIQNRIVQDDAFRFDGLKALYQFRNHLESQTKETIKNGKHFNAELLLEAFKLYDENYQRFGNRSDSAKNLVSWRKVIGYIQRFVPACLAQAIHQGIYFIMSNGEKLQRLSEFKHEEFYKFKLLPLDPSYTWVPGYDFAAGAVPWCLAARAGGLAVLIIIKTYVEQKHQRCKAYATAWKSIEAYSADSVGIRRNS